MKWHFMKVPLYVCRAVAAETGGVVDYVAWQCLIVRAVYRS
jgi:hypothetical protein